MEGAGLSRLALLLFGWVFVVNCSSDQHAVPLTPVPTDAPQEVPATLVASPPESPYYEFTVVVRNPNSVAKTWTCSDCCLFDVEVFFPEGGTAWTPGSCCLRASSHTFAPGETYTDRVGWIGYVDNGHAQVPAPPGAYWAVAGLRHGGPHVDLGDSVQVVVQ